MWECVWYERESGRLQFGGGASDAGRGSGERELCIVPARDWKITGTGNEAFQYLGNVTVT